MITQLLRRLQGHAAPGETAPAPVAADARVSNVPASTGPALLIRTDELAARYLRQLLPSTASTAPADAADMLATLQAMADRLDVRRLPRLPALVPQVLLAARRDGGDPAAVAALLQRDATLAAQIVRAVGDGSGRDTQAPAVADAVSALGSETLCHLVLAGAMRPVLEADAARAGPRFGEMLASESAARNWLCGALASGRVDPGDAQLASVVVTAGQSALLRMMPLPLIAQAAADPAFAAGFDRVADTLSARTAAHWHLPRAVQHVLDPTSPRSGDVGRLGEVLATASTLARVAVLRMHGGADDAHLSVSADPAEAEMHEGLVAQVLQRLAADRRIG